MPDIDCKYYFQTILSASLSQSYVVFIDSEFPFIQVGTSRCTKIKREKNEHEPSCVVLRKKKKTEEQTFSVFLPQIYEHLVVGQQEDIFKASKGNKIKKPSLNHVVF